jgi:hypothetical protein
VYRNEFRLQLSICAAGQLWKLRLNYVDLGERLIGGFAPLQVPEVLSDGVEDWQTALIAGRFPLFDSTLPN